MTTSPPKRRVSAPVPSSISSVASVIRSPAPG